jgi:PIN domain nuclease of toxin-antitoxin system
VAVTIQKFYQILQQKKKLVIARKLAEVNAERSDKQLTEKQIQAIAQKHMDLIKSHRR